MMMAARSAIFGSSLHDASAFDPNRKSSTMHMPMKLTQAQGA